MSVKVYIHIYHSLVLHFPKTFSLPSYSFPWIVEYKKGFELVLVVRLSVLV